MIKCKIFISFILACIWANIFASDNFEAFKDSLPKADHQYFEVKQSAFAPVLNVSHNSGAFKTRISIELPPNFLAMKSLDLIYNSLNLKNKSMGMGMSWDLPQISKVFSFNSNTQYITTGNIGDGELKKTEEVTFDFVEAIQNIDSSIEIKQAQVFRHIVDEKLNTFIFSKENSKWYVLSPTGELKIFGEDGLLLSIKDRFKRSLYFYWDLNRLQSIESSEGWKLHFDYTTYAQHSVPRVWGGILEEDQKKLSSITVSSEGEKKVYLFDYHENTYLTQVSVEGENHPLHKFDYSKFDIESTPKEDTTELSADHDLVIFDNHLSPTLLESVKGSYIHYLDLNGDHYQDKIVFDAAYLLKEVIKFLPNDQNDYEWNGFIYAPKKELHYYQNLIKSIELPTKVYFNTKRETGIREWIEQKNLSLPFMPFRLELEEKSEAQGEFKKTFYQLKVVANQFQFVDFNRDGHRDFIYCSGQSEIKEKVNSQFLHFAKKNRVSLKGENSNPENLFSTPNLEAMGKVSVYYLTTIDPDFAESEASPVMYWQKKDIDVPCNQDSLFFDANNNDQIDILTAGHLHLALNEKQTYQKEMPINGDELFDFSQIQFLDLEKEYQFVRREDDQRLLIIEAKKTFTNPVTGDSLYLDDNNKTHIIPQWHPLLLTTIHSPFGGEVNLQYKYQSGRIVVDKKTLLPNDDEFPTESIQYSYTGLAYDQSNGDFHGFLEVLEDKTSSHSSFQPQQKKLRFYQDHEAASFVFKKRQSLRGRASEVVNMEGTTGLEKIKRFEWRTTSLNAEREYFYLGMEQDLWVSNDLVVSSKSKEVSPEFDSSKRTLAKKVVTTTGHGINSLSSADLSLYKKSETHHYRFYKKNHQLQLVDAITQDMKRGSGEQMTKSTHYRYDSRGLLTQKCEKPTSNQGCQQAKITSFEFDQMGRLTQILDHFGAIESVTYKGNTQRPKTLTTVEGTYLFETSAVDGKNLQVTTPTGLAMEYKYSPQGRTELVTKRFAGKTTELLKIKSFSPENRHMNLTIQGLGVEIHLDPWGRELEKIIDGQSSGRVYKNYHGQNYFFKSPVGEDQIQSYDEHGRILEELIPTLNYHKTYQYDELDQMIKVNDLNFIKNKKGVDGLVLQQVYKEKTQSFAYDAFMRLRHLRELDSHWIYNLADEVISMSAHSQVDNFVIEANIEESNFGERKVDHHGEVHLFNQHQQIISRELINRFGRAVKDDQQFMYQKFDYQKGLLIAMTLSAQGQQYLERISYDQEKRPLLMQTPFVDLKFSYDQYGNISQLNAKSDSVQSEHSYHLRGDGRIKGIESLVTKINYDELGRVQNVQYTSGLSASFDYRQNRLTHILASKNGRELFGQNVRYNDAGLVEKIQTESQTLTQSSYQYDSWMRPQISKSQVAANRNIQGEVLEDNKREFSYCQGSLCQIADDVQIFSDYKGEMKVVKIDSRPYLYKINDDTFCLQGKIIQAVRVQNKIIAVTIDGLSYPVLTDYRGSLIAMFSVEGELLWERSYSEWGEKKISYALNIEAKKLEALTPWSFAHLIEIPGISSADNLYWSKTRVYHAGLHEWMSIDPAFKFNPKLLLEHPGNWRPIEYATGDPLNFVDPSGNSAASPWSHISNTEVNNALTTVAKVWGTAYGIAISPFVAAGIVGATSSLTAIAAPQIASYSIAGTMYFNMSMNSAGRFVSKNPNFFSNVYEFSSNLISGASSETPKDIYGLIGSFLNFAYTHHEEYLNMNYYDDEHFFEIYDLEWEERNSNNFNFGEFTFDSPSFD